VGKSFIVAPTARHLTKIMVFDHTTRLFEPFHNRGNMPIPEGLRDFMDNSPWLEPDDGNMRELIELCKQGRCMTCHQPLDETTLLLVNGEGIAAAFCNGVCATDMHIMGWLQRRQERGRRPWKSDC
jgi:uncharacterized iron-regulated membrane protein